MTARYKTGAVQRLADKGLIKPPTFVAGGTMYETIMGSVAYGVSSDTSDNDVYGFCMPPKDYIFPHLSGNIPGFSTQVQSFDQYQQHHIEEKDHRKTWDLNIYSIIKYFRLCMDNNPNMIDSLFTAENMLLKQTKISQMVRDQRREFLHKGSWHKFKGYAFGQMHKMRIKEPDPSSKRYESIMKYGYDVKFAYHVVRLMDEAEQILIEHDIDLQRNREKLKSIRRGEWTMQQIEEHFAEREKTLTTVYAESKLRHSPDEPAITRLLLSCLEEYYGDLSSAVKVVGVAEDDLRKIKQIVEKW
ncbi:MAG TPA: nucleotidyltransferase [Flavobacterium sp.]|jgi:predicted nucleotidyltransferase|nr:nucleotidyltransferase [Flavobacterium sp.]